MQDIETITLENGATVVAAELEPNGTDGVVLARTTEGEYVTWQVKLHPDSVAFDAFWGHYFGDDITAAALDFGERSGLARVLS